MTDRDCNCTDDSGCDCGDERGHGHGHGHGHGDGHEHQHDHEHGCGCTDGNGGDSEGHACGAGGHGRDAEEATDGPPDPQLDPTRSPGFDRERVESLADIEVGRDVTLGEMDPEELTASDTDPVADASARDLLDDLDGGSKTERRRATLALADTEGSDAVVTALSRAALGDDDPDVRQFAVESLGKLGGERAAEAAREVSRDDDPWVRAEAIVTLDRLDREAHADRMEAALDDDHHATRRNAVISLFKLRGEAVLDDVLPLAGDPSERVREWVAHVLGGIDDDRARRTLEGMAISDDSDIVAITARRARSVDPHRFQRQFTGAMEESETLLPGEDLLNRQPTL